MECPHDCTVKRDLRRKIQQLHGERNFAECRADQAEDEVKLLRKEIVALALVALGFCVLALSSCSTAPVPLGPDTLESAGVVNPSAVRAQRECAGRYKPDWCGKGGSH